MHDQGEFPLVKELGFAVAPGSHTLAGIMRTVSHGMEPPFGECNATETVPLSNCMVGCRTSYVLDKCGCTDVYMRNFSAGKFQTLTQPASSIRHSQLLV